MNTTLVLLVEGCGNLPVRDAGFTTRGDGSIWATVAFRDLVDGEFRVLESAVNGKGSGKGWFNVISPRNRLISREVTISRQVWRDIDGVMFDLKPSPKERKRRTVFDEMPDEELVKLIVEDQVGVIRRQRLFAHNPLAMPTGTVDHREMIWDAWQVAISRGLNISISEQVEAIVSKDKKGQ